MTSFARVGLRSLLTDDATVHNTLATNNNFMAIVAFVFIVHFYFWENNLTLKDKWFFAIFLIMLIIFKLIKDNTGDTEKILDYIFSLIFFGYLISRFDETDINFKLYLITIFVTGFHHFVYIKYKRTFMIMMCPFVLFMLLLYNGDYS
ncbi:hypothetical protein Glove_463g16 [Diversispora epigaea]|uniref:Uncharacterized protein n=1 Tax=Diversispora epigaea TaxID=1348612 RepID=A0A397GN19_9GLOM|nr:hypothetical protein Glove_463g16 [Diversispora epigaea]